MSFRSLTGLFVFYAVVAAGPRAFATEPSPLVIDSFTASGNTRNLRFAPHPAAQAYLFYSGTNPATLTPNTNFFPAPYITGYTTITNVTSNGPVVVTVTNVAYEWRVTNAMAGSGFYRVGVTPMNSNTQLTANVLNRLAYGPTPDELKRVSSIGPQAYIDEQLNMDGIPEAIDNYTVQTTNAIPSDPTTNWMFINMTGTMASTTFYLFTTQPGDAYFDDLELRPYIYMRQIVTNVVNSTNVYVTNRVFSHLGTNVLINGGFEAGYASWTNSGGLIGSGVDGSRARSGSSCLHLVSTTGTNSTSTNWVRQGFPNSYLTTNTWGNVLTNTYASTDPVILSYWYLPGPHSSKVRLQLGSGLNSTPGGIPPTPTWVYAKATGTANATSRIYLYLSSAGGCYVDDLKLVAGSVAEADPNLLVNGDFESSTNGWALAARYITNSTVSSTVAHSGGASLRLVGYAGGSAATTNSMYQNISPALVSGQTYTLSYWYLPAAPGNNLKVQLDGASLFSSPDLDVPGLNRRLNTTQAALSDYRAWFCLHAVQSQRQLFEILSQFWENHFVTQQSKSAEYLNNQGVDGTYVATEWEFREMTKWRNAMLNPNCTFYDLLKISAESPAMIAYLDTVNSRGNSTNIANENFARELLELFTMGVDNGYDQSDIVLMSRAWTGWSLELVDPANASNPFASPSFTYYPGTNSTSKANTIGVWAFNYKPNSHGTNRGAIFGGKTVPARFGPPWTTKTYPSNSVPGMYQLPIPARATGATNGIQDGYDVIAHLANLPFTQEYISVKLCRLFVHDDFPNPTTITNLPEYAFYDYTDPNRSAEAELVRQCMLAWENSAPKGNLRAVLNTIFSSDLFRSHTAAAQKVKTPLEFVASSVRALRSVNANGTATASTDGYSFTTPLDRMGNMGLFDRGAPDGYPEVAAPWISSGTLVERIRFVQAFCNPGTGDDAGNHICDPVGLLKKKLPNDGSWNDAGTVADYFLTILFPGEGAGNLTLLRNASVKFLDTADDGTTSSAFLSQGNTTSTYTNRVCGMVSMLMTTQRFQEQ